MIPPGGVVNAAGYQATIAPGSWVAIYGQNLAADTRTWRADEIHNGVLPTQLDGVSVTIDGKAAAIYYISPTQIDALVPAGANPGLVQVWVTGKAGSSVPSFVEIGADGAAPSSSGAARAARRSRWRPTRISGTPAIRRSWGTRRRRPPNPATSSSCGARASALASPPRRGQSPELVNVPAMTIGGVAARVPRRRADSRVRGPVPDRGSRAGRAGRRAGGVRDQRRKAVAGGRLFERTALGATCRLRLPTPIRPATGNWRLPFARFD